MEDKQDKNESSTSADHLIEQNQTDSETKGELATPGEVLPNTLYLLPSFHRPFFPGQVLPLVLPASEWTQTLKAVQEAGHGVLGLVYANVENPSDLSRHHFVEMGTACRVQQVQQQGEHLHVLLVGIQRITLQKWVSDKIPFCATVSYHPETQYDDLTSIKAYTTAIINVIKELLPLNPLYGEELKVFLNHFGPSDPSRLADFGASMTTAGAEDLLDILETLHIKPRLEKALVLLQKELEIAKAQTEIRKHVEGEMQTRQRDVFLREQLKFIQKELGISKDDKTAEADKFRQRLEDITLPEGAQRRVDDELSKLSVLEQGSPEFNVTRNYLDWITLLPWGKYTADQLDLVNARKVLDKDHEGLDDVKQRIIEFLGVGAMRGEVSGSVILLVGPPGVGKTSLGQSIANALGRKFYRLSLGGIRDEAEIKGHRRTYIGAMPGKFIQAMKETGSSNPVIMLDEIDKIGASFRGDPASALLEVLDPSQNHDFLDHYLDLRFDLSNALLICTANQLDTIPLPLLDRMETIKLSGYLAEEKLVIATRHLIPRQIKKAGLKRSQIKFDKTAVRKIIEGYAREAGVRLLDKNIARVVRKTVLKILDKPKQTIRIAKPDVDDYLGGAPYTVEAPETDKGVVTGLAWTPLGGVTLQIEAAVTNRLSRGFKLTGQLGDVMRESAEIASSYVSSHAEELGFDADFFKDAFIHLHVPAGATPKDGPSAGVTMATALLSLALDKKPTVKTAMTGELTLTGKVMPVGGICEKVIAAKRVGVKNVLLPNANQTDFDQLPEYIRKGINATFASHFDDVVAFAFGKRSRQ